MPHRVIKQNQVEIIMNIAEYEYLYMFGITCHPARTKSVHLLIVNTIWIWRKNAMLMFLKIQMYTMKQWNYHSHDQPMQFLSTRIKLIFTCIQAIWRSIISFQQMLIYKCINIYKRKVHIMRVYTNLMQLYKQGVYIGAFSLRLFL